MKQDVQNRKEEEGEGDCSKELLKSCVHTEEVLVRPFLGAS